MQRMRERMEQNRQRRETVKFSLALQDAAEQGNTQEVANIVAAHGNDNWVMNSERSMPSTLTGPTALYLAAVNGHLETTKALLEASALRPNCVNYADQMNTPLLVAARSGHASIVRAIASHAKTNLNARNDLGTTVLMFAIYDCQEVIPDLLKDSRIDVNVADSDGRTALMHAILNTKLTARDIMPDPVALLLAMPQLLVDARDKKGWTALMYAAQKGNAAIVGALLEKNANPALTNFDIKTAAAIATKFKHPEIAALIEQHQQLKQQAAEPPVAEQNVVEPQEKAPAGNRFPNFFAKKNRDLSKEFTSQQLSPVSSP